MLIGVIDYKYCNFYSIFSKLDILTPNIKIIKKAKDIKKCDKIVIPGTGSAYIAMNYLTKEGFTDEIKNFQKKGKTILGICLGMQIFFNNLYEGKKTKGLNFFDSDVIALTNKQKITTNVGWRQLKKNNFSSTELEEKIFHKKQYYFCHSHYVSIKKEEEQFVKYSARSDYNSKDIFESSLIPSIIERENILGFQFHPEKSQKLGMKALVHFIDL